LVLELEIMKKLACCCKEVEKDLALALEAFPCMVQL
jgi:hypothetical protein